MHVLLKYPGIATPIKTSTPQKTEELSTYILTLQHKIMDLEIQLKMANKEINQLNEQIEIVRLSMRQDTNKENLSTSQRCMTTQAKETKKTNLCILTNSASSGTLEDIEDTFSEQFNYIRYVSPYSNIKQLLENIDIKLQGFDMTDYCIIILGENDIKNTYNYIELMQQIRKALQGISYTNLIICTPTYIRGAPIYNSKVELFNNLLLLELQNNKYAYFYDTNLVVSLNMFSSKTGKLMKSGMKHIYKNILDRIKIDYMCYGGPIPSPQSVESDNDNSKFFLAE